MRRRILTDALRLDSLRERHRRPACSRSRDPLIVAIREAAFKVRLYPDRTRLHVPGAIGGLSVQEIFRSPHVDRIGGRHPAGGGRSTNRPTPGGNIHPPVFLLVPSSP